MKRKIAVSWLLGCCLTVASAAVLAGALMQDAPSTCTTENCASQKMRGFYEREQAWVVQVKAGAGECLRVDVTRQTTDLEMAVISTDVQENHWVDDDSGGGLQPLIKIDPTPVSGWYVVVVSHVIGSRTTENFDVRYGRYNSGNPNCTSPTPPSSHAAPNSEPDDRFKSAR